MVSYQIRFSRQAEKDKTHLQRAGLAEKAKSLLDLIETDPLQTPPPVEKLVGDLSGCYSRRINYQHRLIYSISENSIEAADEARTPYQGIVFVLRMWTHYE